MKQMTYVTFVLIFLTGMGLGITTTIMWQKKHSVQPILEHTSTPISVPPSDKKIEITTPSTYTAREYHLNGLAPLLTKKQIAEHLVLYKKYVDKRNEIQRALHTADRTKVSKTYSPFRALKIAETYAINGQLLHELYFANITDTKKAIQPKMLSLIEKSFSSIEQFKQDLCACALVARGWVVTAYCLDDKCIRNFVLEEHNSHVPVMAIPLLVIDVYEHAYFIDYGTNLSTYVEQMYTAIDWDVIEQRITQFVDPLTHNDHKIP